MKKITHLFNILAITVLLLSACNLPSSGQEQTDSSTAAAQTVAALLSATPAPFAVSPSVTLPPAPSTATLVPPTVATNTPLATATSNCNVAQFITDVTIPDGTIMTPGQAFNKKWRIKNIGSCAWTGFSLVFDSGDSMGAPATKAISDLGPGQEIDLEVALTAPAAAGNYRGYFRINTNGGVLVPIVNGSNGRTFYVDIKVQIAVTATYTLPPAVVFAVTSVNYTVGTWNSPGYVNCPKVTANITTNAAGTVTYHWTRSDGNSTSGTLTFASAGTQSISAEWGLGSVWAGGADEWMGIYIDTPNNQDFGHVVMPACTTP